MSRDKNGLLSQKCITCGRPLQPVKHQWAAGPVCYACWWAAKFFYEAGYNNFSDIPNEMVNMMADHFRKNGYTYPDDLSRAFETKLFRKASTMMRRWWSPKYHVEDENDLAAGTEVSLNPEDVISQARLL